MAIYWEGAVLLAFRILCRINCLCSFPFGVSSRMWNSIVSVIDHCLFIHSPNMWCLVTILDVWFSIDVVGGYGI